jgi:VWFA-related protein
VFSTGNQSPPIKSGLYPTLAMLLVVAPLWAQSDSGVILRSDTRVVQIDVTVRDSGGKPVEDLQQRDFTILDNGKPRAFTIFSVNRTGQNAPHEPAPLSLSTPSARPVLPANVFTNLGEHPSSAPDQHSTVILLDGINGFLESFALGSKGVRTLVDRLPADERIALYVITKFDGLLQLADYTTDRQQVRNAMATFIPRGMDATPLALEIHKRVTDDGAGQDETAPPNIPRAPPRETAFMAYRASEVIRQCFNALAERLRTMPGRKSIYWVTEGFPARLIRDNPAWDKTTAALNDANVAVNTVDEDGLGGPMRLWGGGGIISMQLIAKRTGGQAIIHRNNLGDAMAEGIANSRSSYTLGFYLTELDSEYHELRVHVNRPRLELDYRLGYYAQTDAMHDLANRKSEIESALLSPLDLTGISITAGIERKAADLVIHVQLSPESLTLAQAVGAWNCKLEELFLEKNETGELARVSQKTELHIGQAGKADYDRRGAILTQTMRYVHGATKLILVIRDSASGRTGSLTIPLNGESPE